MTSEADETVEQFLARGGKVQQIPTGVSSFRPDGKVLCSRCGTSKRIPGATLCSRCHHAHVLAMPAFLGEDKAHKALPRRRIRFEEY